MSIIQLTPEQVYNRWALTYERDISDMKWSAHDRVIAAIKGKLRDGARLFEAGAGTGALARKFTALANVAVEGAEISSEMIAQARPDNGHIHLQKLDIETMRLPFPDESFDIAYSCGVLEYIENISLTCAEIARVLKRNGLAVLAYEGYPDADPKNTLAHAHSNRTGRTDEGKIIQGAFLSFRHGPAALQRLFEKAGFKTLQHDNFESAVVDGHPVRYNLFAAEKLFI